MADEQPVTEVPNGKKTFKEILLYKLDRTMAIGGLIALGIVAMNIKDLSQSAIQVVTVIAGGLVTYIGGRTAK
jgi:hypothetical protein